MRKQAVIKHHVTDVEIARISNSVYVDELTQEEADNRLLIAYDEDENFLYCDFLGLRFEDPVYVTIVE